MFIIISSSLAALAQNLEEGELTMTLNFDLDIGFGKAKRLEVRTGTTRS